MEQKNRHNTVLDYGEGDEIAFTLVDEDELIFGTVESKLEYADVSEHILVVSDDASDGQKYRISINSGSDRPPVERFTEEDAHGGVYSHRLESIHGRDSELIQHAYRLQGLYGVQSVEMDIRTFYKGESDAIPMSCIVLRLDLGAAHLDEISMYLDREGLTIRGMERIDSSEAEFVISASGAGSGLV